MEALLGSLMGTGLAIAAGFRAFLPMVALGIAGHFIPGFDLPEAWRWLEHEWVIVIMLVLLIIDIVADKVPWVDSINDVIQTIVRPAAGGIVFGASSGATTALVEDPATFFASNQWVPVVIGVVIALATHVAKLLGRAALNTVTGGAAAPAASVAEDGAAVSLSLSAILFPLAVIVVLAGIALAVWLALRGIRRRRRSADAPAAPAPEN